MEKNGGMTKYAVLPNENQEVDIVSGAHRGKSGIVKESSEGRMKVQLRDGSQVDVSEGACRKK